MHLKMCQKTCWKNMHLKILKKHMYSKTWKNMQLKMCWKKHMHLKHVKNHASKNVFEKSICIQKHVEITYASKNICQKAYTFKNMLKKHIHPKMFWKSMHSKMCQKHMHLKKACTGVWKIKRKTDLATW